MYNLSPLVQWRNHPYDSWIDGFLQSPLPREGGSQDQFQTPAKLEDSHIGHNELFMNGYDQQQCSLGVGDEQLQFDAIPQHDQPSLFDAGQEGLQTLDADYPHELGEHASDWLFDAPSNQESWLDAQGNAPVLDRWSMMEEVKHEMRQ